MITLKRQVIADETGVTVAIILPIDEYGLVADLLEQRLARRLVTEKVARMQQAQHDPLFLADLEATMTAFGHSDTEWWES